MAKEFTDAELHQIRAIIKEEIDSLKISAFVNGDAQLHKTMQQANLDSGKFWREIWTKIMVTMVGSGAGITASFVIYSVWTAIKSELKK